MAPEPPVIEGVFPSCRLALYEFMDIGPWYRNCIRNNPVTSDCLVAEVVWYKERNGVQHEFLRFDIISPDKEHTSILLADRSGSAHNQNKDATRATDTSVPTNMVAGPATPQDPIASPLTQPEGATIGSTSPDVADSASSSADESSPPAGTVTKTNGKTRQLDRRSSGLSSISHSLRRGARDGVSFAVRNSKAGSQLETECGKARRVCTLTFLERRPSANELGTLLCVSSELEPYTINGTQCYWFCGTVFEALKSIFGGVEHGIANNRKGTTHGVRLVPSKHSGVEAKNSYEIARAVLAQEIEQKRRAERQREEERQREREEHRAAQERARAAEEERQKAEERARAAEEANAKLLQELEALRARAGTS
ncbi:hypothetical protein EDD17DRAFT_1756927 [Pisolithus thermaeus]|nr:hypothetical protein EV401DRAFT_2064418 [Pisolithus croceorrhizus]KAI6162893.1 hypothetical protein EDD17DRAFT_1756927 [Pisolithus thermaeus]